MTDRLDLPFRYRRELEALLREHVPDTEVWAYGSRVTGESHPASDLDLVLRGPSLEPLSHGFTDLLEALEDSNIPILVQAHDWARLPQSFHREIERDYVVVREAVSQTAQGEWRDVALGELIDIKHGFAFKGQFIRDEPYGDVLLTPRNFAAGGGFKSDKVRYYDGPIPDEFVLEKGDLLVTMTDLSKQSDTLGYPAFVPGSTDGRRYLHNQRLGKVLLRESEAMDMRFIHYVMCGAEYRNEVLASATGTTVKHTSPDRIRQFRFLIPPLPEQRAIAHVLGTLDDKIELNRRMNQTLEEMARALFKSWFVDFDPVRAKMEDRWRRGDSLPGLPAEYYDLFPDRLVASDLGEIPEGWEVKALGERFNLTMGQSPPSSTYNTNGEGLPFFQGNADFGFRYPRERMYCTVPTRMACRDDTLVSVRAPVGAINMAWKQCCVGRGVAALRHTSGSRSFTYYSAWALQEEIQQYEHTGTVFGAITKAQFEALRVIEPLVELIDCFESQIKPLDQQIRSNVSDSRTLAAHRDALLPKLMSGKLRVEENAKQNVTRKT